MKIRSSFSFSVEDRPGIEVESPQRGTSEDLERIARWPTRLAGLGRQKLVMDNGEVSTHPPAPSLRCREGVTELVRFVRLGSGGVAMLGECKME
jgi:hypothetical protein